MKRSSLSVSAAALWLTSAALAAVLPLKPVPYPALDALEPAVADQLKAAQKQLDELVQGETDATALAGAYDELGRLYHAYQLTDAARACYLNATLLLPNEYRWFHLLGLLEKQAGNAEKAVEYLQRAISLGSSDGAASLYLAEALIAQGEPEQAEALVQRLLASNPEDAAVLALAGELAESQGHPLEAVEYLTHALKLAPDANRIHYPLALAYRTLRRMDEAREHLALAGKVGVRPADPLRDGVEALAQGEVFFLLRGHSAYQAKRYEEAAEAFRLAVAARPEGTRARVNLSAALVQLGDQAGALAELRKVVEVEPDNATAQFNLGSLLLAAGQAAEAAARFESAVHLRPEDGEAHLKLAQSQRQLGELPGALHHFRLARQTLPESEDALLGEAGVLVALGQYRPARDLLAKALEEQPTLGRTALALARLLAAVPDLEIRDGEKALEWALKVYNAGATPTTTATVALAYAELGRCEEAAQWQREAIRLAQTGGELAPTDPLFQTLEQYTGGPDCRPPSIPREARALP
jgi:tetratricopeptide (TPR) repeat protein